MKIEIVIATFLATFQFSTAQKQNNIWYFGHKAGLDFNTIQPTPIMSDLITLEGTASISDPAGHLLFYTNGATVWDRNHNVMPNGTGLMGGESSTQAALIVPIPNSCTQYYLFTSEDHYTNGGLSYSIVDMCLNGGLGDIVSESKNTLLVDGTAEKLTAVLHSNGNDIWIITHLLNSNDFMAFLITDSGVNTPPVVTSIGSTYPSDGHIGPAKASHDGTKLVSATTFHDICEMFDFDPSTGKLSNYYDLNQLFNESRFVYGVEFSSNDSLLYLSTTFVTCYLYQINLESKDIITLNSMSGNYHYGALQLGPDKKIYMARSDSAFLDVIHQPDREGTECQYDEGGMPLAPSTYSVLGLPNFTPYSFFIDSNVILSLGNDTTLCSGSILTLSLDIPSACEATFLWSNGSTEEEIVVIEPGIYWVEVTSSCTSFRDSIEINFITNQTETISASICQGESFEGYHQEGIYMDTFLLSNGCDSIRILNLMVIEPVITEIFKNICHDETFEGYTISGIYADTFTITTGCDSIRILHLTALACAPVIYYDLNACRSYMIDGSHMNYTEFVATYPEFSCAEINAEHVTQIPSPDNKHSCTPGVNNTIAMCVGSYGSCTYSAGNPAAILIDFSVNPHEDSLFRFSGLEFYEKAPATYTWIDGPSGPNNYPTKYGLRILKNGIEIFRDEDVATNLNWTLQTFDFIDNELFRVEENTVFRIELLPYCPVGNGATVSAWDLDEIRIYSACTAIENSSILLGSVQTKEFYPIKDVQIWLDDNSAFNDPLINLTSETGEYRFDDVNASSCFLKGYKNDDVLNGVSTLDLVLIQKHLLGKNPFTTLYQYIAADANQSGNVNVMDLVEIQKVLLGIYLEFPRNTSWRFGTLPQDMSGNDISLFQEIKNVESLAQDTVRVNFVGIKTGDVNGDVIPDFYSQHIETRVAKDFILILEDKWMEKGKNIEIQFRSGDLETVYGLQFSLDLNATDLITVMNGKLSISRENYSINDGQLRFSWSSDTPVEVMSKEVLFSIKIKISENGFLSDLIQLSNVLSPEAYDVDLNVMELGLKFDNVNSILSDHIFFRVEPNPFTTELEIIFNVLNAGYVEINFYDVSGKPIHSIRKMYLPGEHTFHIEGNQLSVNEGTIYCQFITNGFTTTQRIIKF